MKAAVLTVSTSKAAGEGSDDSGPRLAEVAERVGLEVVAREVVTDDRAAIAERLRAWADERDCALVLTSGGTGFAPTDVTPEATRDVIEREAPGVAEALRLASRDRTRHWMLSRGVAGIRGRTLIVNFPGNPRSIGEAADAIAGSLPHALELLAGERSPHA
jgi:molybdopterin adenylyltransferase